MTLQDIIQTARLKLEHHPYGQQLLLLISPFYARPSHFWNSQNSIIGRLGFIVPILPAMLCTSLPIRPWERQCAKMFDIGIDTTTALVTQFIDNYPKIVLFLLAGWVVLRAIKSRNELSSSMEIYGSRIVVFVNTGFTLVLLVGLLYLLRFLVGA